MLAHLARLIALTLLIVAGMFLPFLPGSYDRLAVTLSFMAQLLGFVGLALLAPLGLLWLLAELRRRAAQAQQKPTTGKGYYFALASLVAATLVAVAMSLPAFANIGPVFGWGVLALWASVVWRLRPSLKFLRQAEQRAFSPAPLYLICVPVAVLLLRLALIVPATEYSRSQAVQNSAVLINDIEAYYAANGRYPRSLASVWKDYKPMVIGIEQYYYEPAGDAYNIYFEQFTFDLATREFMVYNKLDEPVITSHDSWILVLTPAELENARGYYAVHDAPQPHWKYFWFD